MINHKILDKMKFIYPGKKEKRFIVQQSFY